MTYLLGTDEAGYGPNLGPLVVSATLWQVPDPLAHEDLYGVFQDAIVAGPVPSDDPHRLAIADSKALFKSRSGIGALELGVLAVLAAMGRRASDWRQLWALLDPESAPFRRDLPWYADYNASLPVETSPEKLAQSVTVLRKSLARTGIAMRSVRSTSVYPARLNEMIDQLGSKGAALSRVTLQLIAAELAPLAEGPILVVCDKHGGRNRYGALLQEHFHDHLIEVCAEARAESVYRTGPSNRRIEFRFRTKGERFLPSALASMVSKYLRELSMMAFNRFWQRYLPDLKPTAGYPVDARRFMKDIAQVRSSLGIEADRLWRKR